MSKVLNRLSSAGEDVVDNVIKLGRRACGMTSDKPEGVADHDVVRRKMKVPRCEAMNERINLERGVIGSVGNETA